ncbi:flagellar hook-basal body complex protein FliE [Polycladidibacter stylochi]|uniref:flagellar hook-basal body complex protein FliE n=1 Tax=Polycladidibacter stylochi TaxID=1807766 RepID=UPI00082C901B|nr:flagellar hook-basal body complex protein FliE [Pseudovibrio stylochi]
MVDLVSGVTAFGRQKIGDTQLLGGIREKTVHLNAPAKADVSGEPSFVDAMAQVAKNTSGDLKKAEAASIAAVKGEASAQQVVDAVMQAEVSLRTAIAVRDKVVAAYQEFSRMAI